MSSVAVVIPVFNGRPMLERLLDTLRAQTAPAAEILVVDNGSTDGAAQAAESWGARVVRLGHNRGFAIAVNRGIAETRAPLVALVNSDVELRPDWIERMTAAMERSDAWFVTGKLLDASDPSRLDGAFDALCRGACPWRAGHARPDSPLFDLPRPIRFASATATLYRRALFDEVGRFDPAFESYLEDVDFSLRCACRGREGVYVPGAVATHRGGATRGPWHPATVRLTARNQLLLVAKHYPGSLLLRWAWPILVAQSLWGLVAARHGAFSPWLRGKLGGVGDFQRAPADPSTLARILRESEREIRDLQRQTGFDPYWRLYFLLTFGGAN
ncbi:MAG: glycosyltransferase family 2 protein [Bryobacteraceae bacterium]